MFIIRLKHKSFTFNDFDQNSCKLKLDRIIDFLSGLTFDLSLSNGIPQTITATFSFLYHIHVCHVDDYSWENSVGLNEAYKENTTSFIGKYNFPSKIGSSHTIISHCHYQFSSNCYTPMWHTTTSGGKLLTCWIMYRVDRPTDTYERGFLHCL